jgi:hypothetical protein
MALLRSTLRCRLKRWLFLTADKETCDTDYDQRASASTPARAQCRTRSRTRVPQGSPSCPWTRGCAWSFDPTFPQAGCHAWARCGTGCRDIATRLGHLAHKLVPIGKWSWSVFEFSPGRWRWVEVGRARRITQPSYAIGAFANDRAREGCLGHECRNCSCGAGARPVTSGRRGPTDQGLAVGRVHPSSGRRWKALGVSGAWRGPSLSETSQGYSWLRAFRLAEGVSSIRATLACPRAFRR